MTLFINTILLSLALSLGQITSCFAADRPKPQAMTPEKISQQVAELDGKRVIVKLKNGKSASGWAHWKSGEKFVIEHTEGIWNCSQDEAISFADVADIKPRNRVFGAVKDTGRAALFIGLLPVIIVGGATNFPPCGW
jgi:hypothetical protein